MKNEIKRPEDEVKKIVFPAPFTKDQLREDLLRIYLLQLRISTLVADEDKIWSLAKTAPVSSHGLWSIDDEPDDYGLSYQDIRHIELAQLVEEQYDFAFHGISNANTEAMNYESRHTWVAAYLMDLNRSEFAAELESYGVVLRDSIARCLLTSELANARCTLEGWEPFSYFSAIAPGKEEGSTEEGLLTIRQMALLSGMEEMTIRTAASRKGSQPLQTVKHDRRTFVEISVAKAWLIAKERYVPISKTWGAEQLNLEKICFKGINDFACSMSERGRQIKISAKSPPDVQRSMDELFVKYGFQSFYGLDRECLCNAELLTHIAELLQLPAQLLILRAKEALLYQDLADTEREVHQIVWGNQPT